MNPITIITVVVVALLTAVIFGLAWLGYASCVRMYRLEVGQGKHDDSILREYRKDGGKKAGGLIGGICSFILFAALILLFVAGVAYKASGESFSSGTGTALVVKTGSMSGFYNEKTADQYRERGYDLALQFGVGDICVFEDAPDGAELVEGEVYAYRYKDIIIIHRLVKAHGNGTYEFRGDNNPASDGALVPRDAVLYRYTGARIPVLGVFVLYAQSYFGMWSVVGIIGIAVSSEVFYHKLANANKERARVLGVGYESEE